MSKFAVIVAAAGKADRFGGAEKKTFAKLDGRPLFLRCLERFITRPDVCQKILVVGPEDIEMLKSSFGANLAFMGVKLVTGGNARWESVASALAAVAEEATHVAVHDAARPCVTDDMIDAVFADAIKTGASILAAPVTGTLKRVGPSMVVEETVSRSGLYQAQTPQVFRKDVLLKAYAVAPHLQVEITDDSQLVEATGHPVSIVESDPTNIKITTKADMALAAGILKARPIKSAPRMGAFDEAKW